MFTRVASGIKSVTYSQAVDSAFCFGWIDGQKGSFDEHYWLQRFTRRKPRSKWSKRNCERATVLNEQGKMKLIGMCEIELAKQEKGPLVTAQLTDLGEHHVEIGNSAEMVTRRLCTNGDERAMLVSGYKFWPRFEWVD